MFGVRIIVLKICRCKIQKKALSKIMVNKKKVKKIVKKIKNSLKNAKKFLQHFCNTLVIFEYETS